MLERDRCKITIDLAVENYFAHPIGINSEGAFLVSIFMHWGFSRDLRNIHATRRC